MYVKAFPFCVDTVQMTTEDSPRDCRFPEKYFSLRLQFLLIGFDQQLNLIRTHFQNIPFR